MVNVLKINYLKIIHAKETQRKTTQRYRKEFIMCSLRVLRYALRPLREKSLYY